MAKKNGKVQLLLWIDPSTDLSFRKLIQQKYEKFERGILSYEGEMALRHWLSLHTNTQNIVDPKPPNPTPKVQNTYARVKAFLLSGLYQELLPGQQIPRKHLVLAIQNVRGSDDRTIKKWLTRFVENGLVKIIGTGVTVEVM